MPDSTSTPARIQVSKVMVINFRPAAVPSAWAKSDDLVKQYVSIMNAVSNKTVVYQVVQRKTVRDYPLLEDGRRYTDATWTAAMADDKLAFRNANGGYVMADYLRIVQDFNLLSLVASKTINEVWMFGGPYFGFYESRMVGSGAFWCNAPPIEQPGRRFVMMGYNYQRDVTEMVHNYGHRMESILGQKYNSLGFVNQMYRLQPTSAPANEFERFLIDHGTTHRVPGGEDYSQDEIAWARKFLPPWWPLTVDPNQV
jgi:hypothetical protein